jgi:3-hydroxybutyryl-CoA dehydrogenase
MNVSASTESAGKVRRIVVVGAGIMGSGIAQVFASAGFAVTLADLQAVALEKAMLRIEQGRYGLRRAVELKKLDAEDLRQTLARIDVTVDTKTAAAQADLVVEAVFERLDLKIRLFRELDRVAPAHCILASNSSGFPITALAAVTDRPDRVIGWHWASPAPIMKLAEIVVHAETSALTRDTVVGVAHASGKNPVVVRDHPTAYGYVADRLLFALMREAREVVRDGVASEEQVDTLVKDCFRWPVGPFEMGAGVTSRGWE